MSDEKKPDQHDEKKEGQQRKQPPPTKPEPKRQRGEFEGWEKGEEDLT